MKYALYEMNTEHREQGVPPHWFSYVNADDAGAPAARARKLGGAVRGEPFDVEDYGRMAVIQDTTGAAFGAWQPRTHISARRVNGTGYLIWNDLRTPDPGTAAAFYAELFGWETEPIEEGGKLVYMGITNAGSGNGGISPIAEQHGGEPPNWLPYFTVPSCDGTLVRVRELGGNALVGPHSVPAGRFAVVRDPQGTVFALFEGETDY